MKRTRNGLSYMGSKYKLFPWIYENLPTNIENMRVLDCFGGGGSISFSLSENWPNIDVTYNELNNDIFRIFNYINSNSKEKILNDYYSIDSFLIGKTNKVFEENKDIYQDLKDLYKSIKEKEEHSDVELYFLLYCGFAKKFKTNAGTRVITPRVLSKHKNYENIKTMNEDFNNIDFNDYEFLYLDPPYVSVSETGHYNNEFILKDLLDKLEKYNGKFMMSNYMNEEIEKWVNKNNYKILIKYNYSTLGRGNKKAQEILIMNY